MLTFHQITQIRCKPRGLHIVSGITPDYNSSKKKRKLQSYSDLIFFFFLFIIFLVKAIRRYEQAILRFLQKMDPLGVKLDTKIECFHLGRYIIEAIRGAYNEILLNLLDFGDESNMVQSSQILKLVISLSFNLLNGCFQRRF